MYKLPVLFIKYPAELLKNSTSSSSPKSIFLVSAIFKLLAPDVLPTAKTALSVGVPGTTGMLSSTYFFVAKFKADVGAIPVTNPVKEPVVPDIVPPVTLPSKLATRVPIVYPFPDVLTVVPGSIVVPKNSLNLSSLASLNKPLYRVPVETYLPKNPISNELAVLSVANFINGSLTSRSITFKYVNVPFTVKLPDIIKLPPILALPLVCSW